MLDTSQDAGKLTARYLQLQQVHYYENDSINVGDCTVYTSPEGLVMMVDCGNPSSFPEIHTYLQAMGIKKIDIFVMSHPHGDHIGCFEDLASYYPIGHVYRNVHEYDTYTYWKAMEVIRDYGIPSTVLNDGDSFLFGEQVEVTVFGPTQLMVDRLSEESRDVNNGSLALRLTYGSSSFWTAGDTYVEGELNIVGKYGDAIQSDIIKMNHHGYDTSSNEYYLETLSPKAAICMSGSLTNRQVMDRHTEQGIETFYTCGDGTVRVSTTGDGTYDIQTQYIRISTVYGDPAPDGHYIIE